MSRLLQEFWAAYVDARRHNLLGRTPSPFWGEGWGEGVSDAPILASHQPKMLPLRRRPLQHIPPAVRLTLPRRDVPPCEGELRPVRRERIRRELIDAGP